VNPEVQRIRGTDRSRNMGIPCEHPELARGSTLGSFELAPKQKSIRSVEGQRAATIRFDHSDGVVPEELVEIVEIAICLRPNIGRIQRIPPDLVLAGNLELAIEAVAAVRK